MTRLLEQLVYEFRPILDQKGLTCRLEAEDNLMLVPCGRDRDLRFVIAVEDRVTQKIVKDALQFVGIAGQHYGTIMVPNGSVFVLQDALPGTYRQ